MDTLIKTIKKTLNNFVTTLLLLSSTTVFAGTCKKACLSSSEYSPCPPPSICAFNAPYRIESSCSWDLKTSATFLWLEAAEENLSLGTLMTVKAVDLIALETNYPFLGREIHQFDFEYHPGFQLGLGFNFNCDNWEIFGEYTYFHSKTKSSINTPVEFSFVIPTWYFHVGDILLDSSSGTWKLDLDLGDLELARQYYVGRCLTFRPFGGLRGAFIRQQMEVTYEGLLSDSSAPLDYNNVSKVKSWGIGPRIGLDTNWMLYSNFRLFINSSASLLYTKYTHISELATQVFELTDGARLGGLLFL